MKPGSDGAESRERGQLEPGRLVAQGLGGEAGRREQLEPEVGPELSASPTGNSLRRRHWNDWQLAGRTAAGVCGLQREPCGAQEDLGCGRSECHL